MSDYDGPNEQRYPFIVLNTGDIALVEEQDFERVAAHSWYLTAKGYAAARVSCGEGRKSVLMHRFILDTPAGLHTDHINGQQLDNRRSNLRAVPASVNARNVHHLRTNNKSGLPGVFWDRRCERWLAYVHANNRRISLGYHLTKEDAIAARLAGELQHWGELCPTSLALTGQAEPQVTPLLGESGPVRTFRDKTHCVHGHALSGDNLYFDKHGWRGCRICRRARRHPKKGQ